MVDWGGRSTSWTAMSVETLRLQHEVNKLQALMDLANDGRRSNGTIQSPQDSILNVHMESLLPHAAGYMSASQQSSYLMQTGLQGSQLARLQPRLVVAQDAISGQYVLQPLVPNTRRASWPNPLTPADKLRLERNKAERRTLEAQRAVAWLEANGVDVGFVPQLAPMRHMPGTPSVGLHGHQPYMINTAEGPHLLVAMQDVPALAVDPSLHMQQREYPQQGPQMPLRTPLVRFAQDDLPLYQPWED